MSKADYNHLYASSAPVQTPENTAQTAVQTVPSVQAASPAVPRAPKPKTPFSPIAFLLVAGVVFLFLGGVIFLTSTWDMLPDAARAIALLSASAVAFGINVLAERVLKLPKTGLAFYILGCIFLPLALGGIGAFSLFGEWFSFSGGGRCLLTALMAACVAATGFLGQSNYKSAVLAGLGLTGTSGAWMFLCLFLVDFCETGQILPTLPVLVIFTVLLVGFAVGMTVLAERYLRRVSEPTPLSRAWMPCLYIQNAAFLLLTAVTANDAPLLGSLGALVLAMLFLSERYITGNLHTGVFGFACGILLTLGSLCQLDLFYDTTALDAFLFILGGTVFLLLSIAALPKLRRETQFAMGLTGMILSIPAVLTAVLSMLFSLEQEGEYLLFLFVPLIFAVVHFFDAPHNPLPKDAPYFALFAVLLFSISMSMDENTMLLRLLLIFAALLLLVHFFLSRRLWTLALSVCTCAAAAMQSLPHNQLWITVLCLLALTAGMVYAHVMRRPVLERGCALAGIPFLLMSIGGILLLFLDTAHVWIITLAVPALLWLAETALSRHHLHAACIRSFCLNYSLLLSIFVLIQVVTKTPHIGFLVLFALSLAVFAVGNLRRRENVPALPMLIFLFVAMREMVLLLETIPSLSEGWVLGIQIAAYLLMLVLFAGMGRFLLPQGFYTHGKGLSQVDWALLTAALPIFSVASTIDWHPFMLVCLLLSVYSLLFIGRVKTRHIPALLASAFGCLTIFIHNVDDPFGILEIWHEADFKSPQILLYLLPMHVFIASLLAILPQKFRERVHMARFVMYCFTMLCILFASLSFNRAEDGIILAVFSLIILVGSFFVKRLRWFALGFSVLFLMTVKLTWEFWSSLHWGIYLFLAGALLIGIAFYYEYAVRRADEKAEKGEPKEKLRIFKEWRF